MGPERMDHSPAGASTDQLFAEAVRCQQQNQLSEAAGLYQRVLALKPDHAEAGKAEPAGFERAGRDVPVFLI